jgi:CIC family chloride channel protein
LPDSTEDAAEGRGNLLALGVVAAIAGGAAGLLVAIFRLALDQADTLRNGVVAEAQDWGLAGFALVIAACALATAAAAALVRRLSPYASGSGIPQVELALGGEFPPAPPGLILVKFAGGLLAIGAGLALGREGPSVQMGAVVLYHAGKFARRGRVDCNALLAAGAGAGLAVAFNAPIAGAVFVLEELVRRFDPRNAVAALAASATAILVARLLLGDQPDFAVTISPAAGGATGPLPYAAAASWPLFVVMGGALGAVATAYNQALFGAIAAMSWFGRWPVEAKAGVIGAAVGVIAWFVPDLVGGGDSISQSLLSGGLIWTTIPLAFLLRFVLGAVSYAAATPGGLFAPMLVLGAQLGLLCGLGLQSAFPGLEIAPEAFAVVGMAAFFTGVVQAPVTGIVLVTEMTAAFTTLLPMLGACMAAMLVAILLRSPPVYDALREIVLRRDREAR